MINFSLNIYFVQDLIEIKVNLKTQTETQTQAIDVLTDYGPSCANLCTCIYSN